MEDRFKTLLQCPLFAGFNSGELEAFLQEVDYKEHAYEKDEILAMQHEVCNKLIILLSGNVRAQMINEAGKIMKVEDLFAPSPLAIMFLFGERNCFPVEVLANVHCEVIVFSRDTLLKVFQQNKKVLLNFLNLNSTYAKRLSDKLYFLSFKTIRQKIANYLLKLPEVNGAVVLDRSQNSLAEYFGVTRPSLSRELANMQQAGLIKINKKRIELLDKNKIGRIVL